MVLRILPATGSALASPFHLLLTSNPEVGQAATLPIHVRQWVNALSLNQCNIQAQFQPRFHCKSLAMMLGCKTAHVIAEFALPCRLSLLDAWEAPCRTDHSRKAQCSAQEQTQGRGCRNLIGPQGE